MRSFASLPALDDEARDPAAFAAEVERVVTALETAARRETPAAIPTPARGPRTRRLVRALALEADDLALLWLGVAHACDPRVRPLAETLCGTEAGRGVTAGLCAAALGLPPERARALAARLAADHPLVENGLLLPLGSAGGVFAPHEVPLRVVRHLAGDDRVDPALGGAGGLVAAPAEPVLDDEGEALVAALDDALAADEIVLLEGRAGSGRRTLAALAAQRRMRAVVALDLSRVQNDAAVNACLAALARERVLRGAVPLLVLPAGGLGRSAAVAGFLERGGAVIAGEPGVDIPVERRVSRLRVPVAGTAQRRGLWRAALGGAADGLTAELAVRFKVSPGIIADVGAGVRRRGAPMDADGVAAAVKQRMADRLTGLAERVEVSQRWEDVVLPADTVDQIRALLARCRNQHQVLEGWGFARKLARGQGVAALFSGAPGTGKTMVAGLIAKELGLDLYQVDLSRVVSKWVGETEKHLGRVFDAAEAGHVVLLFDEADALFGKRAEAEGAQDRWANLEVNYLLQRIEAFGGICLLTTNLDGSLDPAFRRRLAAHIPFWPPGAEERAVLWQRMFPPEAPVEDGIDFDGLARDYPELSGAHIRNAVVGAAFLASLDGDGATITAEHLERAARAEYRSMGHLLA